MTDIKLFDKTFELYISAEEIEEIVQKLALDINAHYNQVEGEIYIIGILKGAYIFLSDLVRKLDFEHRVEFVILKSYEDMDSLGEIETLLDLEENMRGKHVLVVEDIIDTGLTMEYFIQSLKAHNPLSVKICSLLSKPDEHNDILELDFIGRDIPPEFVVGYGLDLNGLGRNLPNIYKLKV